MKKDNLEIILIVLATSVLLLIIMTTVLVVQIEEKILEDTFIPSNENKIWHSNGSLTTGFYFNTSDVQNLTTIMFNKDNSFAFNYNDCSKQIHLTGTYNVEGNFIYMTILDDVDFEKEFTLVVLSDNLLEYRGPSLGCSPFEYSVYILKN